MDGYKHTHGWRLPKNEAKQKKVVMLVLASSLFRERDKQKCGAKFSHLTQKPSVKVFLRSFPGYF